MNSMSAARASAKIESINIGMLPMQDATSPNTAVKRPSCNMISNVEYEENSDAYKAQDNLKGGMVVLLIDTVPRARQEVASEADDNDEEDELKSTKERVRSLHCF